MKGTLYTFKDYYEKTRKEGEKPKPWIDRMIIQGWLKCKWRLGYNCLQEDGYHVFVHKGKVIHLREVKR